MSATLSWASSGLGTKTGTATANLIADFATLGAAVSGGASFSWQVASSNTASSPNYVVWKPKSGAAGRILMVVWTSAPAANNVAILDGSPTTNVLYLAYFPSGNVDTPSNLTAASGTIMGDDTNAVKCSAQISVATSYGASQQPFYFDSAEAMYFCQQNPASNTLYICGAGNIIVDASDVVYPAVLSFGAVSATNFGGNTSPMPFITSANTAGPGVGGAVRTNYGSSNRLYYAAWTPILWANVAISSTDILTNTSTNSAWFVPCQLIGLTKGEGFVLKLRQIGFGPGTLGPLTAYNTTGPVVAARQMNVQTTGGFGYPWLTNFKI